MKRIVVTLLPVGQGAMNLIEIYEGEDLCHLSLIDCGTDKTRPVNYTDDLPIHIKKSVDYVVDKMRMRHEYGNHLYLDYVLFTHRDCDHWTLFSAILEKINIKNISYTHPLKKSYLTLKTLGICKSFYEVFSEDGPTCFSYERNYETMGGYMDAEYIRTIKPDIPFQETWRFWHTIPCDEEQYDVLSLDPLKGEVSYRHSVGEYDFLYIMCFQGNPDGQTTTMRIFSDETINSGEKIECEEILPYAFSIEPVTFWKILIASLEYLLNNLLKPISEDFFISLHIIIPFLKDEMLNNDFIGYTAKTIIDSLSNRTPTPPIVNRFLWGGSLDANVYDKGKKLSRVGNLWYISASLAKYSPLEVHAGDCFQLLDNIHLQILERIASDQLHQIQIHNAASISSAIERNATSAVSLLSVAGNNSLKFLFTGDATIHTFHSMADREILNATEGAVWTAPHHGSYTTAKGSFFSDKNNPTEKKDYFPEILSYSKPQAMVIESGLNNRHGLPNMTFCQWVINHFEQSGLNSEAQHFVYVNQCDNKKNRKWAMKYTSCPIYSGVSANLEASYGLQPPIITYKIHRYTAEETDEQYTYSEETIETGGIFRGNVLDRRQPGQPAPPPQDAHLPPPPPELFLRRE